MDSWEPSKEIASIWHSLHKAVPEAELLLAAVTEAIVERSPQMWAEMSDSSQAQRRDQYLIRYTLPLAEIAGWPARMDDLLVEGLALHWMFAVAWRRIDDVLDGLPPTAQELAQLTLDLFRVGGAYQALSSRFGLATSPTAQALITQMCRISTGERQAALPAERIWERAAPFLIVPRSVLGLSNAQETIYRDFLSADGLTHDVHDLPDDLARGIRSLPASWLQEFDPRQAFRRNVLEAWCARAAREITSAVERTRSHDPHRRYRSLAFWLDIANAAAEELISP